MSFEFFDPIITKRRSINQEPLISKTDIKKIINNIVILDEIPDKYSKCTVTCSIGGVSYTWYEINSGIPSVDTVNHIANYLVDYTIGQLTFPIEANGETATISSFGTGCHYFPATRVYTKYLSNGNGNYDVTETLQELVDGVNQAEDIRVENEGIRQYNEGIRQENESTRNENEGTRVSQESTRQNLINELGYKGIWTSGSNYKINNVVTYNNSSYLCISDIENSIINPSEDTICWRIIALAGSVAEVISSNSDILIQDASTSPILTLNSGMDANQIVKRNTNAEIPGNVTGNYITLGNIKLNFNSGLGTIDITTI